MGRLVRGTSWFVGSVLHARIEVKTGEHMDKQQLDAAVCVHVRVRACRQYTY